jgi:hypothetical protein
MFIITWIFDKLGYMPKFSIDIQHPFPAIQKEYVAPDFEKPVKTAKIRKATTRAPKPKK